LASIQHSGKRDAYGRSIRGLTPAARRVWDFQGINKRAQVHVIGELPMRWPGSKRNVQKLVDEHYEALYRYAYRLSGSAADAEDLTQETFCQAQTKLGQLRDWDRAKAWLFSILRNGYLHRMRAHKVENLVSLEGVGDVPDRLPEPLPEVDPARLQEALNELPELFRTPIILYYFEDFSYRDIAAQMDVALGTVMSRLARAKVHLRARLLQPALTPALTVAGAERRANDGL
jgi:RNA polymerase sigma-70 factor, ECF subfamily